ncbi:MAG: hypothetical protein JJ908_13605 [Rhizobiales bacterium]|nr:hypothetical protein [Hyphomicrobiales bacterium]MBO6699862.1 hypothetical protein [Hyphomicrobiales bacterium]MBO6737400.1 hypothetical protein [Hyphomicrobiales bacterium]MBO6911526.1 hypothetical protein [Hyphomicrobiales bacterium]MBO6955174.1 hypothetical protein [Hyphomicrobiales bacterium]
MQEKTKTVWSMAALAFLPVAAVTFGVLWVAVIAIGEPIFATPIFQFDSGALPLFAGIALSFLVAVPIAYLIARAMMTRDEKRRYDNSAATRLDPSQ